MPTRNPNYFNPTLLERGRALAFLRGEFKKAKCSNCRLGKYGKENSEKGCHRCAKSMELVKRTIEFMRKEGLVE